MNPEQFELTKKFYLYDEFMQKALDFDNLSMEDYMQFMPKVLSCILNRNEKDPVVLFENLIEELRGKWTASKEIPFHGPWHHGIMPAVFLQALSNLGDPISAQDVKEGFNRGLKIPAGACGFCGTCGAGSGVGIALSIAQKTTPFHEKTRSEVIETTRSTLHKIAKLGGPRCCRLSAYAALEEGMEILANHGFSFTPRKLTGYCEVYSRNAECHTIRCPYYAKTKKNKKN